MEIAIALPGVATVRVNMASSLDNDISNIISGSAMPETVAPALTNAIKVTSVRTDVAVMRRPWTSCHPSLQHVHSTPPSHPRRPQRYICRFICSRPPRSSLLGHFSVARFFCNTFLFCGTPTKQFFPPAQNHHRDDNIFRELQKLFLAPRPVEKKKPNLLASGKK